MIEIDKLLEKCGNFHRYQYILIILFCALNLISPIHYYSQTIISFVPEYWCSYEGYHGLNFEEIRNISTMYEDAVCKEIETNLSCTKWIYNYEYNYHSMISELNWVCDDAWKTTFGQSMFFIGSVIGTLSLGIMADKVGRLPILITANLIAMAGGLLTVLASTLPSFAIFRFISGLATDCNYVMMYILVMEYMRPSMRTVGLNICCGIFYCLGSIITPWVAVWLGNWKLFLIVTSAPFLIVPFFYFFLCESAEWLITKRKYDKAAECFQYIAKINHKNVNHSVLEEFKQNTKMIMSLSKENENILGLFKTPRLRKNILILFFKSMVITLCYDAISRNVEGLGLSPFLMFSLSATAILPGCLVLILLQDKIGRKAMASSSLLISGIFTTATGIIIAYEKESKNPYLLASLAVIGRFGVSVAYNSSYQYAAELIPTCVRGQGVAAAHVAGYALTFFSSYILYLQRYFLPLPSLILGCLSFLGAGLCLLLPETLNKTLPGTLEEAENFGRGERWYDFPKVFGKLSSKKSESTTQIKTSSTSFCSLEK